MNYLFIVSTASCIFEILIPIITKFLTNLINFENESDRISRKDLITIKNEMNEISMVDEFAKYAKLQRRYNKLEAVLSSRIKSLMMTRMKLRLSLTYGLRILNALTVAVLLFLYRLEPVTILPNDSLWPLHGILSWPCPLENSVSLTMWIAISRIAVSSAK